MPIRIGISLPSIEYGEVSVSYTPPPPVPDPDPDPDPSQEFDLLWGDDTGITWGSDTIIDYPGIS